MPTLPFPQPISNYVVGDTWVPQFTITVGGVKTDAQSLTVRVERPDGTYYDLTYGSDAGVVRTEEGVYQLVIPLTATRRWKVRVDAVVVTASGTITRYIEWWAEAAASKLAQPN